jgi:hypothetical protein
MKMPTTNASSPNQKAACISPTPPARDAPTQVALHRWHLARIFRQSRMQKPHKPATSKRETLKAERKAMAKRRKQKGDGMSQW